MEKVKSNILEKEIFNFYSIKKRELICYLNHFRTYTHVLQIPMFAWFSNSIEKPPKFNSIHPYEKAKSNEKFPLSFQIQLEKNSQAFGQQSPKEKE